MSRLLQVPLRWMFSPLGTLAHKAARAGVWLLMGDAATRIAGLLKMAILARVLSPADFGLMGIAIITTRFVEHFTELGFNAALIQRNGDPRPYLNTIWTAQLLRGVALSGVVVFSAPLIGRFFGEPATVPVLRVLTIELLLRSLVNPAVVCFRQELDMRRDVAWRLTGAVAGLAVGIPLALTLRSVWALVLSLIVAAAAETFASYWIRPYKPALGFDWDRARELRRFGRWVLRVRIVSFLNTTLDSFAVGKLLGPVSLGLYQMAHVFAFEPASTLGVHAHGVMFPAFSRLQTRAAFRSALLPSLRVISSLLIPLAVFVTVFGDSLVYVVLGPQWTRAVPLVTLLIWAGALQGISYVLSALLMATGKPALEMRVGLVRLLVVVGSLYPSMRLFGLYGASLAMTLGCLCAISYQAYLASRLVASTGIDFARVLKVPAACSMPFVLSALIVPPGVSATSVTVAFIAAAISAGMIARVVFLELSPGPATGLRTALTTAER